MIISLFAVLFAISIHEFAHAWTANRLGDPTASLEGRMTLNPLAHIDILGVLALFLVGFGWGKPVPIDTYNLRSPRRDSAIISLSGPLANIVAAIILAIISNFFPFLSIIFYKLILINLGLGFFNLLPIPPLDGSKIILGFLPFETSEKLEEFMDSYGTIILLFFLLPLFNRRSLAEIIISPLISLFFSLLVSPSLLLPARWKIV